MSQLIEVKVPDIGDYKSVPVIEVHVQVGDTVAPEQTLVTLESDKATMDVPSPSAGVVREVKLKVGDNAAEGITVVMLEPQTTQASAPDVQANHSKKNVPSPNANVDHVSQANLAVTASNSASLMAPSSVAPAANTTTKVEPLLPSQHAPSTALASVDIPSTPSHATPSVRQFARELGVDVTKVLGTGPKGRITQDDVRRFIKDILSGAQATSFNSGSSASQGSGLNLLPWPKIDFSKFGPTQTQALSRVKKISAANLARNWAMIPAVTYHEEADITDLEAFRVTLNKEYEKQGTKITMLAFLLKASAVALKKFPEFNASLDDDNLILKQYVHIGFAADTPQGLLVPVIRDVDRKGIVEIAEETAQLAQLARAGKLKSEQMQGGCFTISSVGGLGGTSFSPIINAPEVAILGVSKSTHRPVWDGTQFLPRLTLPLSLSADHRVIDGALATRFNAFIAKLLTDFRRVML